MPRQKKAKKKSPAEPAAGQSVRQSVVVKIEDRAAKRRKPKPRRAAAAPTPFRPMDVFRGFGGGSSTTNVINLQPGQAPPPMYFPPPRDDDRIERRLNELAGKMDVYNSRQVTFESTVAEQTRPQATAFNPQRIFSGVPVQVQTEPEPVKPEPISRDSESVQQTPRVRASTAAMSESPWPAAAPPPLSLNTFQLLPPGASLVPNAGRMVSPTPTAAGGLSEMGATSRAQSLAPSYSSMSDRAALPEPEFNLAELPSPTASTTSSRSYNLQPEVRPGPIPQARLTAGPAAPPPPSPPPRARLPPAEEFELASMFSDLSAEAPRGRKTKLEMRDEAGPSDATALMAASPHIEQKPKRNKPGRPPKPFELGNADLPAGDLFIQGQKNFSRYSAKELAEILKKNTTKAKRNDFKRAWAQTLIERGVLFDQFPEKLPNLTKLREAHK